VSNPARLLPPARPHRDAGPPKTTEAPTGTYTISPIRFPKAGRWVITYHLFEDCMDLEDSPHGHASFYIDVP